MNQNVIESLRENGYAIQEDVISSDECVILGDALEKFESDNRQSVHVSRTDSQTVIFSVHTLMPELFLNKIDIPAVMNVVGEVLKEDFILSNFNASRSGPQGGCRIHIDSRVPVTDFDNTLQIVAMLCLDDFEPENGSTRVWPNSHLSGKDPRSLRGTEVPGWVAARAKRGSVVYVPGQTWHDVGANNNGKRRWGIIAYYSRWWIKPTFDFTRCGENIYSRLTERQKSLFGFNSRPPLPHQKRVTTLTPVSELSQNYEDALRAL